MTVASRDSHALILCTVGIEAVVAATVRPVVAPRTALIVADPLVTRPSRFDGVAGWAMRRVDAFAVIRSADREVLSRRFAVESARIVFQPFPVLKELTDLPSIDGDYVYSAGWAHRDWSTLVEALAMTDWPAVLAPGADVDLPEEATGRITVVPIPPPDQGREYMSRAGVVALSFHDTDLPSGPLVLLDALAMGKPTVVSDVAGSRDYVVDGVTALVVPAGDSAAMADALTELRADPGLRRRLGQAAREWARESGDAEAFVHSLASLANHTARQRGYLPCRGGVD